MPQFVPHDAPVYIISVAAELAGMHAQTLRQYDRLGLVSPTRNQGGGRRYSTREIEQLREVQRLSQEEGISLAGIARILDLERKLAAAQERAEKAEAALDQAHRALRQLRGHNGRGRVFAAGPEGIVALRAGQRPRGAATTGTMVLWQPR